MNKSKLIIFAAASMACQFISARNVTVADPGSLSSLIDDLTTSSLSINGTINASDLFFIADNLSALSTLDLSNASIAAYSGETLNGQTDYAAGLIPQGTFAGTSLEQIVFPTAGAITIGDMAFAETKLSSVQIPSNVQSIGSAAFACCDALTAVEVPACEMSAYAFSDCKNITDVTIGANTAIAEGAFARCTSLSNVNGASTVTSIGNSAFVGCSGLQDFDFGKSLTSIGAYAFQHTALTTVDLTSAESLTSIGAQAFANNSSLETVKFNENGTVTLGEGTFFGCTSITTFILPNVSEMPDYLLTDMQSLQKIELPGKLAYIGDNAMSNMTSLQTINASNLSAVPDLGSDVWHNVDQQNVKVVTEAALITDFEKADQWKEFTFEEHTAAIDVIANNEVTLKGRFVGDELQVVATGCEIARIALYNAVGATLTAADVHSDAVSINTAAYSTQIYIVNATLSNGSNATLKLIRK